MLFILVYRRSRSDSHFFALDNVIPTGSVAYQKFFEENMYRDPDCLYFFFYLHREDKLTPTGSFLADHFMGFHEDEYNDFARSE